MDRILRPQTRRIGRAGFRGEFGSRRLDGVRVSVGGQNAFVRYISPGQVNVQVPSGVRELGNNLRRDKRFWKQRSLSHYRERDTAGLSSPSFFHRERQAVRAGLFADGATFTIPRSSDSGCTRVLPSPGKP